MRGWTVLQSSGSLRSGIYPLIRHNRIELKLEKKKTENLLILPIDCQRHNWQWCGWSGSITKFMHLIDYKPVMIYIIKTYQIYLMGLHLMHLPNLTIVIGNQIQTCGKIPALSHIILFSSLKRSKCFSTHFWNI